MSISAKITGITYAVKCTDELTEIEFDDFDINFAPAYCLINYGECNYGISKWVTAEKGRSYPFERVYNTLIVSKRITVIPIIKDGGLKGKRDFIQWDTVSLMSQLDVYVIFAFFTNAVRDPYNELKIIRQQFENDYVKKKILEISNYHGSAAEWNLKELAESLTLLIDSVQEAYSRLEKELYVKFHKSQGIVQFKAQFQKSLDEFMTASRNKAKETQNGEMQTIQPEEFLSTSTKTTITIEDYLGGKYYFTVNEISFVDKYMYLIERKHSNKYKLPLFCDIKGGLLKMILYCNLRDVKINDSVYTPKPVLRLTSTNIIGKITSLSLASEIGEFKFRIGFSNHSLELIDKLFSEANTNNFEVIIEGV
jgi:DNA-binding transcriptional regulator YhcF (GntR family)